jgi:hypothetical protein
MLSPTFWPDSNTRFLKQDGLSQLTFSKLFVGRRQSGVWRMPLAERIAEGVRSVAKIDTLLERLSSPRPGGVARWEAMPILFVRGTGCD